MLTADVHLLLAIAGTVTVVLSALIAVAQSDIRRALAYIVLAQIGYMVLGIGVGSWAGALFHLITCGFIGSLLLHLRDPVAALAAIRGVLAGGELLSVDAISPLLTLLHPSQPIARFEVGKRIKEQTERGRVQCQQWREEVCELGLFDCKPLGEGLRPAAGLGRAPREGGDGRETTVARGCRGAASRPQDTA